MLKIPWTTRRTNKSVLVESRPPSTLEALMLKHNLSSFGHNACRKRKSGEINHAGYGWGKKKRRRGRPCMCWMNEVKAATKLSCLCQSFGKHCRTRMFGEIWSIILPEVGPNLTDIDKVSGKAATQKSTAQPSKCAPVCPLISAMFSNQVCVSESASFLSLYFANYNIPLARCLPLW